MQRLMIKLTYSLLFIIFFSTLFVGVCSARSKIEHYQYMFLTWGFRADVLNTTVVEDTKLLSNDVKVKPKHLILLSSQYNDLIRGTEQEAKYNSFTSIVLICDERLLLDKVLICDRDSVFPAISTLNVLEVSQDVKILHGDFNTKTFLVVPETTLTIPFKQSPLSIYISAFTKNTDVKFDKSSIFIKAFQGLTETAALEFTVFCLILSFLTFILANIFLKNDFKVDLRTFLNSAKNLLYVIQKFLENYKWMSIYLFLILLFIYIPVITTISYRDVSGFDINYILSYIIDNLDPKKGVMYIGSASTARLALVVYNYLIFAVLTLILLPFGISYLKAASLKILDLEVDSRLSKFMIPTISFVSILCLLALPVKYAYLFLSVLGLYQVFFYLKRKPISLYYTNKQKVFLVVGYIAFIIFGKVIQAPLETFLSKSSSKLLFPLEDRIVFLPFIKPNDGGVIFEDFYVSKEVSVMVDEYGINYPGYKKIVNTSMQNFDKDKSYLISGGNIGDFLTYASENKNLLDTLTSKDYTNVFYIQNAPIGPNSKMSLEFTLDCALDAPFYNIKLKARDFVRPAQTIIEKSEILDFPGCYLGDKEVIYNAPLNPKYIADSAFFEIIQEGLPIKNVRLILDNKSIPVKFLNYGEKNKIYAIGTKPNFDTLYIYSSNIDSDWVSELDTSGNSYNISSLINDLKTKDLLENPFVIWPTHDQKAILKNDL